MKRIWCRTLSVFIIVLMLFSTAFVCTALDTAQFSFSPVNYDKASGKYVQTDIFGTEDTIILEVSVSGIENTYVRGNAFTIDYDETVLTFLSDSSVCTVSDENAIFSAVNNNGKVLMNWDTTSKKTTFNGAVYYFKFKAKEEIEDSKNVAFNLEVTELYASLNGFPDIPFSVSGATKNVTIASVQISDNILALFDKLENITTNSLNDIVAALNAYNNELNAIQKKHLKAKYPEKYNWLSTAYDRYYKAVDKAEEDKVNSIVKDFNDTYGALLKKGISKVTLKDAEKIAALDTAFKVLPSVVVSRLPKDTSKKINALLDRIETLTEAQAEAKYFRETYSQYYNLTDAEGLMIYDSYNDTTKSLLSKEYKLLSQVNKKMQALIENDAKTAALNEKVNAFQQKWLRCFTLNPFNVSVGDKAAIQMAMADYETLDKDVKEKLAAKISVFKNLLSVIEKLEEEAGKTETIEIPGETVTVEKEVIKTETIELPGEQTIVNVPGETVTVEKEVIKTETVEVSGAKQGFTRSIYILFILLAITLLMALLPAILEMRYRKMLRLTQENILSEDYEEESNE